MAGVGVAAASAYNWMNKPKSTQLPFELDNQTLVEVKRNSWNYGSCLISLDTN